MNYIFDRYTWTDDRKVLTKNELIVPGLEMFGHYRATHALTVLTPHMHTAAEFLYIANGAQKYCIEDKEYLLTGNQVLIVKEHTPHSTGPNPYGRYNCLWFQLDIDRFAASLSLPKEVTEHIVNRLGNARKPLISLKENLYGNLQAAFYELASADITDRLKGYSRFVDFIICLVKYTEPQPDISPQIQLALRHIDENICAMLPLEELSEISGLSLSGFKQKFRRETGISPREYINIKKIKKAKELLSSGMSVTDTAFALDFSSSSYFSVLFKQMEDISPSEYRNKMNIEN